MLKNIAIRVIAMAMAFAMVIAMAGCYNGSTDPKESDKVYTVKVVNRAGAGMKKCSVEVFSDATKTIQVYKGIANDDGEISFTAPQSDEYVAVISKLPMGYAVETEYALAGERTEIILAPGVLDETAIEGFVAGNQAFTLGDAMMDFTVTLSDNTEIKLSELLNDKKAVVLNFWFMNCEPCKMEFPYIQEGYEQLKDDIAVLALNPVDSTPDEVANFQADHNYTFTMSKCDVRWQNLLKLQLFPTTLIIDRYGNICLIHSRGIESTQEFLDMVNYFIQDDYEQKFFKSAGQIPAVTD